MAATASPTRTKQTAAKKARTKKATTKKAPAKKAATKTAPAKKAGAKEVSAKKTSAKKASARQASAKKTGGKTGSGKSAVTRSGLPQARSNSGRAPAPAPAAGAEQPMMRTLRAEHRHMATVMQLFSEQLAAIEAGDLVDPHVVYEIMDYMVHWPDRFHHPREDLIYARVAEVDPGAADDVDTLQRDHDATARRGQKVLKDIEAWRLGEMSGPRLIESARAYIEHQHEHMQLEEKLVFPRIERTLDPQDWREIGRDDQLVAVSEPVFGPGVQREFRNMSLKLRRSIRRTVERGTLVEWIGIEAVMESVEVVSMAYEAARDSAGLHLRGAFRESTGIVLDTPLLAPLRVTANNTRLGLHFLGEMLEISRDTAQDLARVNRERRDRLRLLDRNRSPRRHPTP